MPNTVGYSWAPLTEVLGGYVGEIAPVCAHNTALKSSDDPVKIVIRLMSVKLTG